MSDELLLTKLIPPTPRSKAVSRPRLLKQLDRGLERKLTLVSASAGSGKTTLLAEWTSKARAPVGWLSLDAGDNDPWRFLAYLVAAIGTVAPKIEGLEGLGMHPSELHGLETRLVHLANQLADLAGNVVVVLDDYHLITAPSVHQVLERLVELAPSCLHIYLSSRADPPLPLARLRARDQLVELRVADLRFLPDEAAAFLTGVMGLDMRSTEVDALAARTEGWAAGLQLAGLSLQRVENRAEFVANFAGSHAYVADYLLEEVLNAQSESVTRFLLQTSILPRLTAPLCDAVTQERNAQALLERLNSENLFVSSLDPQRRWYVYHQLFADLLRHRLQREQANTIPELHARAARWHLAHGSVLQAVPHLFEAGLPDAAADAIEQVAGALLQRSEVATLKGWLELLPKEQLLRRPGLSLWCAWAYMLQSYSLGEAAEYLRVVEQADPRKLHSLRAYVALFQGRLGEAQQLAQEALSSLAADEGFLRQVAAWVSTMAQATEVDLYTGSRAIGELAQEEQVAGNPLGAALSLNHLAELYLRQGKLREAECTYLRVLGLAVDDAGQALPISGMALVGLAEIARERNDLSTARQRLTQGMDRLKGWGETAAIDAHVALAGVLLAQGDELGAIDAARRAHELACASDATDLDDQITALLQSRLWIRLGDLQAARYWLTRAGAGLEDDWAELEGDLGYVDYHLLHHRAVTCIRIYLAERSYGDAIALLDRLLVGIERFGWRPSRREIEVHLLRALALAGLGQMDPALMALQQALAQAEPGGYVRTFVDEGPPMARLLQRALEKGIQSEYARKLLHAFPELPGPLALAESLSEREIEVLSLIAEGLTNQQIADHLIVAIGTVKAHSSNVYGKLGVRNRLQAVARARELGLI